MLNKMRNILPTIWRQLTTQGIPWMPVLTAGGQTKLTWAKFIELYDAVPKAYQGFFDPLLADGQGFPYTIFTPARDEFFNRTTEKLICILGHEICVLEKSEDSFEAQYYPVDGVSYIEIKTVLLDSHFKISGMTKQGVPASSTIRFNSVGDYLFTPILKNIRLAAVNSNNAEQNSESNKFDHLMRLNYKFMNYARRSLLTGEKVIHFILQPEIRAPIVKFFDKTYYRVISPTHISILTDRELIIIREDEPKSRDVSRYGGIWDYIQLNKIKSLTLNRKDNDLLVLSIKLQEGAQLENLFQASAKEELDQLLEQFNKLAAK